ncbi:cytochrome ubiquinol oxidase subunit I [Limibacter armeniacum]|uniref:cytochrome ubiquinol oxidase subunit I n=1 Tax=Limibacter armeniacum TaxID=466084 RepID=UPI002FE58625
MNLDVEILARIQFAFTIMFHYIFPPFTMGTGFILVIMEGLYLKTGNKAFEVAAKFWTKIFAANFSIGVATGIVMEFEFGTNWATYSRYVGDIFGSPLAAEGIFAFFLESGFLALLLFGWNRVTPRVHFLATCMVSLGSLMSGFWIVVANSWMQTPTAYEIVGEGIQARAVITDFWAMVFNPSMMIRYTHTIIGAFIQSGFLVMSVSAYYLIKKRHKSVAKRSFKIGLYVAFFASLIQPILGHEHAKVVAEYQPTKLAAFEGLYETTESAPLYILGFTDPEDEKTYGIAIPGMLSFLISGSTEHSVKGLKEFPKEDWPGSIGLVFQSYHLMVGLGTLFILMTAIGVLLNRQRKLFENTLVLRIFSWAVFLPVLANQAGWVSAEVGRQPWIVYGMLRTNEAISKSVTGEEVLTSIILFFILYVLLFFTWLYILDKEIKHGPDDHDPEHFESGYLHRAEKAQNIGKAIKGKGE